MNFNTLSIVIVVLIVVGFSYLGYRLLKQRLDHQRYQEHLAELEFQALHLTQFGSATILGDDNRFVSSATAPADNDIKPVPPSADAAGTAIDSQPWETNVDPVNAESTLPFEKMPADVAASAVINQLTLGGVITGVDGYLPLHGNEKGVARLRFRNRKQALLVPYMESEAFLRHYARRADMIIMVGADGKAVVVTPLEQLIAESISPS